ncbi:Hypothetical predicted protein, partial [Scomber scombrus]
GRETANLKKTHHNTERERESARGRSPTRCTVTQREKTQQLPASSGRSAGKLWSCSHRK